MMDAKVKPSEASVAENSEKPERHQKLRAVVQKAKAPAPAPTKFAEEARKKSWELVRTRSDLFNHVTVPYKNDNLVLRLKDVQMPWVGYRPGDEDRFVWGLSGRKAESADLQRAQKEANEANGARLTVITHVPLSSEKAIAFCNMETAKESGLLNLTRMAKSLRDRIKEVWRDSLHDQYPESSLKGLNALSFDEMMLAYPEVVRESLQDNDALRMIVFYGYLAGPDGKKLPGSKPMTLGLAKREYIPFKRPDEAEMAEMLAAGHEWRPAVEVHFRPQIRVEG